MSEETRKQENKETMEMSEGTRKQENKETMEMPEGTRKQENKETMEMPEGTRKQEIREAMGAGACALASLRAAQKKLESARQWGIDRKSTRLNSSHMA